MLNLPTTPALQSSRIPEGQATSSELNIVKIAAALVTAAILIAGLYYGRDILIPLAIAVSRANDCFSYSVMAFPISKGVSNSAEVNGRRRHRS